MNLQALSVESIVRELRKILDTFFANGADVAIK